ncbi:MAG: heme exporter protein CcmB [Alphaproteobacteria bacterium]
MPLQNIPPNPNAPIKARLRAAQLLLIADWQRLAISGPAFAPPLFFILAAILFAIADGGINRGIAGILAALTLLASAITLDSLFEPDQYEERLPILSISILSHLECAAVRMTLHFLITFPGLAIALSILFLFWQLPINAYTLAIAGLALACFSLSALATWIASLLLGARRGSLLLGLVFLPLATPVLTLLAALFSSLFAQNNNATAILQLLAAAACFYSVIALLAAAAALRGALY